ncbi:nucleotidyl transferase AbiEii/AbiGii toxin family protein [Eggerthia catenaformis]
MIYLTGIHALNIPCSLETTGDWHASALKWDKLKFKDSQNSIFKEYGIEKAHAIPNYNGIFNVANTIRACLDMLEDGDFSNAQGMNNDYICNEKYDNEVFSKVIMLKENQNWKEINHFMKKEYKMKWILFRRNHYSENNKPLKIETSFRRKHIASEETFRINGIRVYNINTLCIMKSAAYQMRDKIRDLFDLSFIINNYYNDLDKSTILNVQQALAYKGLEQFDYLAETQQDELINKDDLADSFMNALDKLDLLVDSDVLKRRNSNFFPADLQNEEDSELEL